MLGLHDTCKRSDVFLLGGAADFVGRLQERASKFQGSGLWITGFGCRAPGEIVSGSIGS